MKRKGYFARSTILFGVSLLSFTHTTHAFDLFAKEAISGVIDEAASAYSNSFVQPLCSHSNTSGGEDLAKLEYDLAAAKEELLKVTAALAETEKLLEADRKKVLESIAKAFAGKTKEQIAFYFNKFTGDPTNLADLDKILPDILHVWSQYQIDSINKPSSSVYLDFPDALSKLGLTHRLFQGPGDAGPFYIYWSRVGTSIIQLNAVNRAKERINELLAAMQSITVSCTDEPVIAVASPAPQLEPVYETPRTSVTYEMAPVYEPSFTAARESVWAW